MAGPTEKRIHYLEKLLPKGYQGSEEHDKDFKDFSKYACYMGNGIYKWRDIMSTDTGELFLMVILRKKGIKFKER